MFSGSVQPAVVSLFSSTGSEPLYLWSVTTDSSLPSDSFTCFLDDSKSTPTPPPPAVLISPHPVGADASGADRTDNVPERMGYALTQTVLHIQSPSVTKTYLRCPPFGWARGRVGREGDLGLKHPWVHIQVRNMGRSWSFELGLVDQAGKEGVVRCSTFQNSPKLKPTSPPLLHLPLTFPTASTTPLTSWSTITMYLPSLISHFSTGALARNLYDEEEEEVRLDEIELPSARFSHVSYVKIYATCRLKRIWFSEADSSQRLPWEFELYAEC
ncbi:hypothetical protein F5148DRAFT_976946 [Russula earlei]|uniref:Uncharacterized protein n=1 Tax=Russula earlei TaxID=71964 RepID=A0ACC0UEX1_9AGAM|nr:hypothetical protein F5148DRAFT_976946 [Russula earlei]